MWLGALGTECIMWLGLSASCGIRTESIIMWLRALNDLPHWCTCNSTWYLHMSWHCWDLKASHLYKQHRGDGSLPFLLALTSFGRSHWQVCTNPLKAYLNAHILIGFVIGMAEITINLQAKQDTWSAREACVTSFSCPPEWPVRQLFLDHPP